MAAAAGSGLMPGSYTGVVRDPGAAGRYYAAAATGQPTGASVYVTNNSGQTWQAVNNGLTGLGAASRLRLALHRNPVANTTAVYAALVGNSGQLSGLFRSGDGANWAPMDTPSTVEGNITVGIHPGQQGGSNLSLEADPTNANVVFIGGDVQPQNPGPDGMSGTPDDVWPNSIGSVNFTGRLFRGDASQPAGSQFYAITDNGLVANSNDGASGTAPHADSRDIAFDASGNLVESDDGGVYALINPNSVGRVWRSRIGNIAVTEFVSMAFDARLNRTVGGAQDTGVHESGTSSVVPGFAQWNDVLQADGETVASDTTNATTSYHYYTNQNLKAFHWRSFDTAGAQTANHPITLLVNNTAGGLSLNSTGFDSIPFNTPYAVNAVDGTRMIIGTTFLYESFDRGDNLFSLGGLNAARTRPAGSVGTVTALAYGAAGNAGLLYVGTSSAANRLLVRTSATGMPAPSVNYPGTTPRDIALDPATGDAYVLDTAGSVWQTVNSGASWVNLTGTLGTVPGDRRTIVVYRQGQARRLLVGGQAGVFRADSLLSGALWQKFGRQLPHAPVNDLLYDATADLLIAGTLGRGAYVMRQASQLLTAPRIVTFTGDDTAETFGLAPHPNLPGYVSVTRAGVEIFDLELSTIDGLVFNGQGGLDRFDLNFTPAGVPISFNGGTGNDTLNLGAGNLDSLGALVNFDGGSGSNAVVLNDTLPSNSYSYDITASTVRRNAFFGGLNYTAVSTLTLNCGPGASTVRIAAGVTAVVHAFGNDGNDDFIVGGGNLNGFFPQDVVGGNGTDTITYDDSLNSGSKTWDVNQNARPQEIIYSGLISLFTTGFESVAIRAGSGNDEFDFTGVLGQGFNVDGGGSTDTFVLGYQGSVFFANPVALQGGAGGDSFTVNDAAVSAFTTFTMDGGELFNSMTINEPSPVGFTIGGGYFAPQGQGTFAFDNMNTAVFNGNANNNLYTIYSAGQGFGTVTVNGNLGDDTFLLAPQPGGYTFDHLTLDGNQGNDTLTFDASALLTDERYTMGADTLQIARGVGTETIAIRSMIRLGVKGGAGNDTFAVNVLTTARPAFLDGGAGGDTYNVFGSAFGASAPVSLTLADSGGFDTFNLNDQDLTSASNATYLATAAGITRVGTLIPCTGIDVTNINSGAGADRLQVLATPGGEVHFFGGAGNDELVAGGPAGAAAGAGIAPAAAAGLVLNSIRAGVFFDGEGGSDFATIDDSGSATGKVAHLDQASLGAVPQDTLFGSGGSLRFARIETLELYLGSGADTVYAQPNASAAVGIAAGASSAGDALNLALALAVNPVVTENGGGGTVTSGNLRTLTFTGVDLPVRVDAVAPRATSAQYLFDAPRPALRVTFSEDVSASLRAGLSFTLDNLTTGQRAPADALALASYDPGTNSATLTFPGLPGGLPPDGRYTLTLTGGGVADAFGNRSADNFQAPFFAFAGDFNRDGAVTVGDLGILASNFGQSGRSFSQGDASYDGTVTVGDLGILATNFNKALPAAGAATSAARTGTAGLPSTRPAGLFSGRRVRRARPVEELELVPA